MSLISPNPGINLEVTNVEIDSDRITHVSIIVTDASGQPMSPDDFSMSFMLSYIADNAFGLPTYHNYFTRTATGQEYILNGEALEP